MSYFNVAVGCFPYPEPDAASENGNLLLENHQNILAHIREWLNIVSEDDNPLDEARARVKHAYTCLFEWLPNTSVQEALIKEMAVVKLAEKYLSPSMYANDALSVLARLVYEKGNCCWKNTHPQLIHEVLNKVAFEFDSNEADGHEDLCTILRSLLASCSKSIGPSTLIGQTWPASIVRTLDCVLSSYITPNYRRKALLLAYTVLNLLEIGWTEPNGLRLDGFFLLVVQKTLLEIRELNWMDHSIAVELMTACIPILEISLKNIDLDQLDLLDKEKLAFKGNQEGTSLGMMNFLTSEPTVTTSEVREILKQQCICIVARLLSVWLGRNIIKSRRTVELILPVFFSVVNNSFYLKRHYDILSNAETPISRILFSGESGNSDTLRMVLPLMRLIVQDRDMRQIFLQKKQDKILYDCFVHYWNVLSWKITPTDDSYFILSKKNDAIETLISICKIFMIIVVRDESYVACSPIYFSTRELILNNLVKIQDFQYNLELTGHLTLLGLQLLKFKESSVDLRVLALINIISEFLEDAYEPESENWQNLVDLWYLAIKIMPLFIQKFAWLIACAFDSCWPKNLIRVLDKVKDESVRMIFQSAYENLFCCLINTDDSIILSIASCKNLFEMCRNYGMNKLADCLRNSSYNLKE